MRFPTLVLYLFSLAPLHAQSQLRFVSYNCENLFDCRHDSLKNDYEFLPDGERHWTFTRYWKKLNDIGRVIHACGEINEGEGNSDSYHLPDLVTLVEVENDSTLFMLTHRSMLRGAGYRYVMTNSNDPRGVDVAMLYNPLTIRLLSHQSLRIIPPKGSRPTRDVLYTEVLFRGTDTLHVLSVHAPSRGGGQRQTEPYRMAVAERICQTMDSIRSHSPDANIIIAGDFNDYSKNKSLKLLSQHGMKEAIHQKDLGTYKYQGQWNSLDHILLSPSLYSQLTSCTILHRDWLTEEDSQGGIKPFRTFLGPIYHGGISDHLPVVVQLSGNRK